ncbi:type II CAAX endopeptidase family protein [Clostridium sp. E02]|uniref:CPBP family intramembrane glutamic endopeptidase n=1 Tax=Clostridium sp. E02 TaxID=2487134 RepID=UPI000F52663E|nr:type II CAAX endopeptidase family protein [Clostridium sp. E02]
MIVMILHLILPIFFYTMITTLLFMGLELGALEATAISAVITIPILIYIYGRDQKRRGELGRDGVNLEDSFIYIVLFGLSLCILGNFIVESLGISGLSKAYEEAAKSLYSPSFAVQIMASGLVIPIAEELIFRGMIFASLKERLPFFVSAFLSAGIFALFHGNLPQGMYAFLLGFAAAWLYQTAKGILAPCVFHISANLFSLFVTNAGVANLLFQTENLAATTFVVGGSAALSVFCMIRIYWKNNSKEDIV